MGWTKSREKADAQHLRLQLVTSSQTHMLKAEAAATVAGKLIGHPCPSTDKVEAFPQSALEEARVATLRLSCCQGSGLQSLPHFEVPSKETWLVVVDAVLLADVLHFGPCL